MGERRNRHDVSGGKALREDDSILDVTAWREDVTVKLVDIKDEVNDEQAATRQTIIDEHTSTRATIESVGEEIEANNTAEHTTTRATIESVGEEIEANNTAEHTSTRQTITTKSDEEQAKLDVLESSLTAIQTEINDEAASTRGTITTKSNEEQGKLDVLEASLTSIESTITNEGNQTQTAISNLQTEVNDEAATTRGTITTKSDEEQVKLDDIETAINAEAALTRTTITSVHARVHAGQMFSSWVNDSTMSNGDTINLKITTGAGVRPHLIFDVKAKLDFDFKVIEGATSSGGTSQTPFNKNRGSTNTADAVVVQNATGISGGTTIIHEIISGGQKVGSSVDYDRELILDENESYIFQLTSLENSNIGQINLDFYEP